MYVSKIILGNLDYLLVFLSVPLLFHQLQHFISACSFKSIPPKILSCLEFIQMGNYLWAEALSEHWLDWWGRK